MRIREHLDVVVVGAGPYGLSVAAHLAARNLRYRVFGVPMQSWRQNMPQGMFLKSPGRASNLADPSGEHTLERFCSSIGSHYTDEDPPVSAEIFARYGEWFQRNLVPEVETSLIVSCEMSTQGFLLQLEGGEALMAKSVVIAAGHVASARMPEQLMGLPKSLVSHSSVHSSLEAFRDKDVIVLGAGQSALESAALLSEAGARPSLVARRTCIEWGGLPLPADRPLYQRLRTPTTALGYGWRHVFHEHPSLPFYFLPRAIRKKQVETVLGPFGSWWLRDRVEDHVPILTGWWLNEARAESEKIVLRIQRDDKIADLQADHVIAATGYRVSPASFPFLSSDLKHAMRWDLGAPVLTRNFESSVPGLHFVGLASAYSFGPVMRFVAGAHPVAPRLGRYLAARHARRSSSPRARLQPAAALT